MEPTESSTIRRRSRIEFCIEAFVEETAYVPLEARLVRHPSELSPQLERLVRGSNAPPAWRAWVEGPRGWFVQGRLCELSEDRPDQPTVYLIFRDHEAMPVAAGGWCRSAPGRWDPQQYFACHLNSRVKH